MRIDVHGCGWFVEDHGEGVPLVLLHGFPLSSEIWTPIRPALEQVSRLITPDLRGFGESDACEGDYTMEALAEDLIAVIDRLEVETFVLGGHSMGGYVALRVAARYPERLRGLVLVDTRASADTPEVRARRNGAIEHIRTAGSAEFLADFIPKLIGPTSRHRAARFIQELQVLAAEVADHVLVGCLAGMRDRPDSTSLLPGLTLPALVVVGEEDEITPLEEAQAMASALPGATLAVIPEAGHTPSVERPIATADALARFARSL